MPSLDGLLIVAAVAFAAPFLLGLAPGLRIPAVVLELVAGIVVGPSVLGWVEPDPTLEVMAALGLAFLLFIAGLEVDFARLRGPILRATTSGYAISLALAVLVAFALAAGNLVQTPLLVAVALGATSLGVLIPVLKDTGHSDAPLGQLVIAGGSIADFAAIVLLTVLFAGEGGPGATVVLVGALVALAGAALVVVRGAERSTRIRTDLLRLQDTTAQIRVRGAVVLLVGFAAAAHHLGLEVILGAFAAGAVLTLADPDEAMTHPDLRRKLEAIGFGVFIPVFFIVSGVRFDLGALTGSTSALATVPLFVVALLVVRGVPALRYARLLDRRETVVAGLLQATSLPFLVTATAIGGELGLIGPAEAAALVGAGLVSVLLFPAAGLALLRPVTRPPLGERHDINRPEGRVMPIQCSSFDNDADAHAEVERLLAAGTPGARISVLTGRMPADHRRERVGAFAGMGGTVGAYAGATGSAVDDMGAFAGPGMQRRGGFGDADRDVVATYPDGVRREHVASHRELEKRLTAAGLDPEAASADVASLHAGRVLVVVSAA